MQNDRGFQDGRSVVFHSYVKARIACLEESNYKDVTKPGAVDYYYNVVSELVWGVQVGGERAVVGVSGRCEWTERRGCELEVRV